MPKSGCIVHSTNAKSWSRVVYYQAIRPVCLISASETRVRVEILQFIKKNTAQHYWVKMIFHSFSLIFLCFALYHEFFPSIRLGDRLVSRPISLIIEPLTTQWQRENGYWLLHCYSRLFVFQILLTRLCLRLRFDRLRFFVFGFVSSLTLWFPRSLPYYKQVHKENFEL